MKKSLISVLVLSLVIFSGCTLFSGKNSANEEIQVNNNVNNNIETQKEAVPQEVKIEDQVLPQAEAQNQPAEIAANEVVAEEENAPVIVDNEESPEAESPEAILAKCLTAKGAVLYTSSTCPHCKTQKELFKDGLQYLENIECLAMDGWSQLCTDKEVNAVPTWILADGEKIVGARPLETLAETIGCEYSPESTAS